MTTRRELLSAAVGTAIAASLPPRPVGSVRAQRSAGDVFDVRDFGAPGAGLVPEHAAINAALRAAGAAAAHAGSATVHAPAGRYLIGASVLVPSRVTLDLHHGATLVRHFAGGDTANATVRNASLFGGDTDIAIVGGTFTTADPAHTGKHVALGAVERFRLTDVVFAGVAGDWNTQLDSCTDGLIRGLVMHGSSSLNEDGLHLNGGERIVIADCVIRTGDDALALTTLGAREGMADIVVSNCQLESATNAIRLLVVAGARGGIRGVTICNVRGRCGAPVGAADTGNGISIENRSTRDRLVDVSLTDVTVDCSRNGGAGCIVTNAEDVRLTRVRISAPSSRPFELTGNARLALVDCDGSRPRSARIQCLAAAACDGLTLRGGTFTAATEHAVLLSRCTDVLVDGIVVDGAAGNGVTVEATNGVRLVSSRVANVVGFGVQTIGATHDVTVALNDLRGNRAGGGSVRAEGDVHVTGNAGFVTEASGSLTIPSGATSASVAHGLAPGIGLAPAHLALTPTSPMPSSTRWWIAEVTDARVVLRVDPAPDAPLTFAWRASRWP